MLEHTADIGFKVYGRTLNELFENAANALFEIMAEADQNTGDFPTENFSLKMEAENEEDLLIRFLSELISLSDAVQMIFKNVHMEQLGPGFLRATYEAQPREGYQMLLEIKAATYHQFSIKKEKDGFAAQIILDV